MTIHPFFSALATLSSMTASVFIAAAACAVPIVIVGLALYFKHQREKMWHETTRLALEKGVPVPPRPLSDEELGNAPVGNAVSHWAQYKLQRRRWHEIRNGLVLIAIGGALFLHDDHSRAHFWEGRSLGAYILLGLGLAFLISGLISAAFSPSPYDDSGMRPPLS